MGARNAGFDGVSTNAMNALENLSIEVPSWGFANTGTRFGKYLQPGAAITVEEKFADAAQVNALTGITPQLALHVQWDLPAGIEDAERTKQLAAKYGVRPGSINPILIRASVAKRSITCWSRWK
jgi:L-rhamnose isomerase / sugar isomerase